MLPEILVIITQETSAGINWANCSQIYTNNSADWCN